MIDVNITNSKECQFGKGLANVYESNTDNYEQVTYCDNHIVLRGVRFRNCDNDFYENNEILIVICGTIFFRVEFDADYCPISASSIVGMYLDFGLEFLNQVKGSFIVVIYEKRDNVLYIINSQIGLRYLYYKQQGSSFYVSTSLGDFKRISFEYDKVSIIEQLTFSYPISEHSLIKDVCLLQIGQYLRIDDNGLKLGQHFSADDLFPLDDLIRLRRDVFVDLWEKSVIQRANTNPQICVSLTGGFDGRANISVLLKKGYEFVAYSFGRNGGENTSIPKMLSEKTGLEYVPIYLNDEFEKEYSINAIDAIFSSDGLSRFDRANYMYAMKKLTQFSTYNITGLLAESITPVHLKHDYLNDAYYKVIYGKHEIDIRSMLQELRNVEYINPDLLNELDYEEMQSRIHERRNKVNQWKKDQYPWVYYLKDLISIGFQRFYGAQAHLERRYCENLTPIFDLDILMYLYSTTHLKIFKRAFRNSPLFRVSNRVLQSWVIKDEYPVLGEFPVDRGFPPNYNLDFRRLSIPYLYYKRRLRIRKGLNPDFRGSHWNAIIFSELKYRKGLFNNTLINQVVADRFMEDYSPARYSQDFNRVLSLALWMGSTKSS